MNVKVANRYVELLTDIIDVKVRIEGKNITFKKEYIMSVLNRESGSVSEKVYKETVKWFKERFIFDTEGETFGMEYKLHNDFKYKLSKKRETIIAQCRFIIGQLFLYSDTIWGEAESLYADVISNSDFFQLLPTIKPKVVKDTISAVIVNENNKTAKGQYPYNTLRILQQTKSKVDIQIKSDSMDVSMKNVIIKKVNFNTDTVTVSLNNSQFTLDSLSDIVYIKPIVSNTIFKELKESMEYLEQFDSEIVKNISNIMDQYRSEYKLFMYDSFSDKVAE